MLTDTELDTLARAVAALGDEDAGRLDGAVRERRRAKAEAERIAELRALDEAVPNLKKATDALGRALRRARKASRRSCWPSSSASS